LQTWAFNERERQRKGVELREDSGTAKSYSSAAPSPHTSAAGEEREAIGRCDKPCGFGELRGFKRDNSLFTQYLHGVDARRAE
jgi:hypothetical protein